MKLQLTSEDVKGDEMDLGVSVLASLRGGHLHNLAGPVLRDDGDDCDDGYDGDGDDDRDKAYVCVCCVAAMANLGHQVSHATQIFIFSRASHNLLNCMYEVFPPIFIHSLTQMQISTLYEADRDL